MLRDLLVLRLGIDNEFKIIFDEILLQFFYFIIYISCALNTHISYVYDMNVKERTDFL